MSNIVDLDYQFNESVREKNPNGYINYLYNTVKVEHLGQGDKRVDKLVEAEIAISFERAMLASHFRKGSDSLMAYDGRRYIRVSDKNMQTIISDVMKVIDVGSVYQVNSTKTIISYLISKISHKFYDPKKNLVSFRNKLLDLDTMIAHDHNEMFETHIYNDYDYDPKATCNKFKQFLIDTLPDESVQMVLQEFIGCMFVDRTKIKMERVLYMLGGGRNGKGVLSSLIEAIAGQGNYTSMQFKELFKASNKEYNIAKADGMLVNICGDMSKDDISGGEFKTYVSGEPMNARRIYCEPFTATRPPILIASMNELPVTTDHTLGQIERPIIIPFEKTVRMEDRDTELPNKLKAELAGIFNWVAEGRNRFIRNRGKFTKSAKIDEQKELAKANSNSVMRYLVDNRYQSYQEDDTEERFKSLDDIYSEYSEQSTADGVSKRFSKQRVGSILTTEGFVKKRRSNGWWYYLYVKPLDESDEVDIYDEKINNLPF